MIAGLNLRSQVAPEVVSGGRTYFTRDCFENEAEGFGVRRQDAALSSFKAVPRHRTPRA